MATASQESLPKTMRAVVCHGPEDYRLEEVPTPVAGPGEVVVRVDAAGICASDVKCYTGAPLFWGDANRVGYCQPPIIAGHEFIGTVVALGEGAGEKFGLALGDRAISEQIVPCWECRYCQRGQYHLCRPHDIYGFRQRTPGGFADYMKFPAGSLNHRVPASIPADHAALIEPLACSMHAVQRGNIEFGDTVVIAGCGTLGLGMVAYARMKSPGELIAIDLAESRLERARSLGATQTLNPTRENVVQAILDWTDGYGCDVYIEATGHPASVEQGLLAIRKAGTFVEFSVMREPVTTDWTIIGDTKELNLMGSHLGPYCYPSVIRSLETGAVDGNVFITHRLPLERFEEGIDLVRTGKDSLKVLLIP
ncbi:MAG: alcohol dehydrogenase catalytic domain-containing protein [Capsulimonadales bacterium]|nr:alcohol dehydrogenase catalytic domain-containing protein [Capsulimonadales bacterium]